MKNKYLRLCAYIILALTLLNMPHTTNQAHAQETSENAILFVAPNRVVIPSGENIAVVNVSNRSTEARRYDIAVIDQTMNSEGMTRRVDDFPYSAKRMLRFQPKRFTLQPGERQIIRIMAQRPADLADGDYHSHILFREVPLTVKDKKELEQDSENKTQFEIRTLYGIAIPAIVQKGQITSDLSLVNAAFVAATEGMPAHIAIDLKRTGNAEAFGIIRLKYNKEGKDPVMLGSHQWMPVYREVDMVTRRIPIVKPEGIDSLKGGTITVELYKNINRDDEIDKAGVIKEQKEIKF